MNNKVYEAINTDSNGVYIGNNVITSISENDLSKHIEENNKIKYNESLDKFEEIMTAKESEIKEIQNELGYEVEKADLKPMFNRIIIKPFKQNPFQKMEVKNGIIIPNGFNIQAEVNPQSGKYEELEQFIITGCVQEIGPDVKYIREGDVIYYRKDTAVPVPFLSWGLFSIAENQVIAVVNEGLTKRFNKIKGNE